MAVTKEGVAQYAAVTRLNVCNIYAVHGADAGTRCARAAIRETAAVLATLDGKDAAVALLDEISNSVLAGMPLPDLPERRREAIALADDARAPAANPVAPPPDLRGALAGYFLFGAVVGATLATTVCNVVAQ